MRVPFIDLKSEYEQIRDEIDPGFRRVFERGDFILGKEEREFETDFSRYCGVRYAVGVNSGTDALYLALASLDIGPGDEVILPTFTFIATALCVSYTGAKVVFADIEEETYNLDPRQVEELITPKTKAIIPVHIYGQAADMEAILKLARAHDLKVIEDAAQAHGARYKDQKIGSLGDMACFSFYPTKGLGAFGDAGMIVTQDTGLYEKLLMLRDYGRVGRYHHKIKGFNSRLDTLQAVVLLAKLKRLDDWNKMRQRHAAYYGELLQTGNGIQTPAVRIDRSHVFQTFVVRIKDRDRICEALQKKGIEVLIHYPVPLHLQEAYYDLGYKRGDFPVAERVAGEVLSLPMFPFMTKKQIESVCGALKDLVGRRF